MSVEPGTTLGPYSVTAKIGAGGMGEVYQATDTRLGRTVAIKVLREELAADPERLRRFEQEARSASALNHPNIITIHDIGKHGDTPYIAMEFVEGKTLREMLAEGPLSTKKLLPLAAQIAEGLAKAHAAGIVHRDLKPENLMVSSDGYVKILDFGLAKLLPEAADFGSEETTSSKELTRAGVILGTVGYMSPEQASGRPLDYRSDQFSFGSILYEMATGKIAFKRETAAQMLAAIIEGEPEPVADINPNVPPHLRVIVERCLEKHPEERYESTRDLARELEGLGKSPFALPAILTRRTVLAGVSALVVLGIALLVGLDGGGLRDRLLGGASPISALAVLPLVNQAGDPEQEYFVDGMTEELITDLSRIGALSVIGRRSAMRYRDTEKPLAAIARELNVDAVVEGSVLREADRVRISAQLIEAATERILWAGRFERNLTSILALQADVARAIAREIEVTLTPEQETLLASAREVNPETYEAYLKGMFHLFKGTPDGAETGMAYLHEAVEKDPADPLAYAGLALGYVTLAHDVPAAAPADALQRARSAVEKALALDDTLAEAMASSAFLKGYYDWQWDEAFQLLDRALEINPSLAIAHYHQAWFYYLFGRMEEAIAAHERAQQLDPLVPAYTGYLAGFYRREQRYEEALEEARKTIEIDPDHPLGHNQMARVYLEQGKTEEAILLFQKTGSRGGLRSAYEAAGQPDEARKLAAETLAELKELPITGGRARARAAAHLTLGEKDEALRWLDYEPPSIFLPWIRVQDRWAPLHSDPRFQALLRKMNLPPVDEKE